jgi:hypothetical protein
MINNGTKLLDNSEGCKRLSSYITTGLWWVIVPMDQMGAKWLCKFEEEFYDSKGFSKDFHAMSIPRVAGQIILSVFFAKKSRVSLEVLEDFMPCPLRTWQDTQLWGKDSSGAVAVMKFLQSAVKAGRP